MTTPEKELKHCTACNQMTNHSGETCLKHTPDTEENAYSRGYKQGRFDAEMDRLNEEKHTPDTEWVTQFENLTKRSIGEFDGVEATLWDVVYDYQTNQNSVAEEIVDFISSLLTSRDTYWKERVEEVISKIEESARKLNTSYVYEEGTYKGMMYSISLIRDITNEDNLK